MSDEESIALDDLHVRAIDVAGLIEPSTRDHSFSEEETLLFLQRLSDGWGEYEAGLAAPLGWSPARVRRFISDPYWAELIWAIHEADNESVERAIKNTAKRGNPASQKLWAFNKMQHRGWADKKSVKIEGEVDHAVVVAVKQALDEQTRELVEANSIEGIAALQEAIGLGDAPEEDIIDAEVVE